MSYSVGEVSRMAGVTVRTLHHYDQVGLLSPTGRTEAGYRQYDVADLDRLQQILCYRELGFGLEQITEILDDPRREELDHLRRQHELLTDRITRLHDIVAAVELMMEARQMGISLNPEELLEVFGDHDPTQYAQEVEQRWGDTDAYQQSHRRTSRYSKSDWLEVKAEAAEAGARMVAAKRAGLPPDSEAAMEAAEAARLHIHRRFYDLTPQLHRHLGDMYVADPRFTKVYEDQEPGLAQYVRDAIHANAERAAPSR